MAEKISTLILKVDLDCHQCYKKIRKILCKLQGQERIRTISYDDKSSTIVIVGPFGQVVPAIIEEEKPKERPAELEPPKEKPIDLPVVAPVEERPPPAAAAKPVLPADVTPLAEIPSWPGPPPVVGPTGPCGCSCCTPCYQGYYEGCRCCHCGRVYGYAVGVGPTPPAGCYGGADAPYCGAYRGCQLFSESDTTTVCSIM